MSFESIDKVVALRATASVEERKVAISKLAMEVNAQYQAGDAASADFIGRALAVVREVTDDANIELRINCLIDGAHFFYLIGQTFKAIEPAGDAVQLATRADRPALLRRALTLLGMVYGDTGNLSRAIECYDKALEIAQSLRDADAECAVWINIGVALLYAAQYRDAIACFEHVLRIAGNSPPLKRFRGVAFSNISLCCLHLEDFSRGLKAVEICIGESGEPHTTAELVGRTLRETYYTRLLLEMNSVEKAGEHSALARKYAVRSKSARAEIAASIADGLYQVEAGRIDVGISRLMNTLEKARLLRSMLRDTLAALVKAYEVIGQPDRALIYLREMMEALRQTQQENALLHVDLHLKQIGREFVDDAPITTRLQRQEAALQGKVAEQELFRSR
ncbi:MAG TPA: tetratricopeptide repeat protein, partial [Usitatibacter sp.]|nr:tetratricopeptide repeat protein [Usitatibacter sp.]